MSSKYYAEYEYKFKNRSTKIVESGAKIKFDLTEGDKFHKENDVLTSEKVIIPEIDAHW